ncbi:MAG: M48 family peptidase [Alphaproteobacteria bacterium HGW-Alphaproteobacteria-6]|nr:MAG: M48 family peptidase [Alphaproteobacteria bacterium HGW-Alphaproteobacteria-6]
MSERILPGEPPVTLFLRRSARARRFALRVSRLDGQVTLSMPLGAAETEALAFARAKAGWIRGALAATPPRTGPAFGASLPFEGRSLTITAAAVRTVRVAGEALLVPAGADRLAARIAAFLKLAARQRLQEASARHAAAVGRSIRQISLRDTRSRWGSCTADGRLMYSWRLIMAPPPVLDYVAAHEVAHLVEMNHSPAFWALVARLLPGHAAERQWLRRHGAMLHRIDFGPAPVGQ